MVQSARLDTSVESMSDIRESIIVDTLPANHNMQVDAAGRIDWGDASVSEATDDDGVQDDADDLDEDLDAEMNLE